MEKGPSIVTSQKIPKSPTDHLNQMRQNNRQANSPVSAQLIYIAHKYVPKEKLIHPGSLQYKLAITEFYQSVLIPVRLTRSDIFIGIRYLHINGLLEDWVNVDIITENRKHKDI